MHSSILKKCNKNTPEQYMAGEKWAECAAPTTVE